MGIFIESNIGKISGQIVYLASGFNDVNATVNATAEVSGQKVRFQAFDPSGNQWQDVWVSQSGGHDLRVNASVTADISGQTVKSEVSGQKIRLQGFDPSGNTWNDLIVNQSGGNVLRVDAGSIQVASNVSGNKIRLQGFDPSGNTWNDLIVNSSGSNILRVDAGAIQVSANVSGNIVYLTSGQNETLSNLRAFDPSGAVWRSLWVERSGGNRLLATISGDAVTVGNTVTVQGTVTTVTPISGGSISGVSVITAMSGGSMSGQFVNIAVSGGSMSGQFVNIAVSGGSMSGQTVTTTISGNVVRQSQFTRYNAFETLIITALSGGTALNSGISDFVIVKNAGLSGCLMFVGYSGTNNSPWVTNNSGSSGRGLMLTNGDSATITISNPAFIRVAVNPDFSGSRASYTSVAYT